MLLDAVGFLLISLLYALFALPSRFLSGNAAFMFLDAVLP